MYLTNGFRVAAFSFFCTSLLSQTPQPITATGVPRLVRVNSIFHPTNGSAASSVESVMLSIYASETGDAPLWQETQNVSIDNDGHYSLLLGSTHNEGLPIELFASGEPRWLGVQFQRSGEGEQPRVRLASVPYALKAQDADTLGGQPLSAFVLANPDMAANPTTSGMSRSTGSKTAAPRLSSGTPNYIGQFVNATDLGNSVMYQNLGKIGLGTTNPLDYMHVAFNDTSGAVTGYAVQNLGSGASSYSGTLFYDQTGALAQFQGFNNSSHEYRINNIASNGSINFMIGSSSKFFVANNGSIGIGTSNPSTGAKLDVAGTVKASGGITYGDGTQQTTAAVNPKPIALLRWYAVNLTTQFTVGTQPSSLAFDGDAMWVANLATNNVTKLRASDGANLGTFAAGTGPWGIAFDGGSIWVTNQNSNNVTKLRASDGSFVANYNVGNFPQGVVFDGSSIWVANSQSNTVTKLRPSDGMNLGNFNVCTGPGGIAFDGASIWVACEDNHVTKLRASDGFNQGNFPVGTFPVRGVVFDGANIWVTNNGSANVTKLRASDGMNLGTFNVGNSPTGAAFDGANIWVANFGDSTVTKLRASDGVNLGTFGGVSFPGGVAFDGANIWIANFGVVSTNVSKL